MSAEDETAQPAPASDTSESQASPDIPVVEDEGPEDEVITPKDWVRLPHPVPIRLQANFTALAEYKDAEDVLEVLEVICAEAEQRGFFFDFSHFRIMEDDEILAGTPLYNALTGEGEPQ